MVNAQWTIALHRSAIEDLDAIGRDDPEMYQDIVTSLKELRASGKLFDLARRRKGALDFQVVFPDAENVGRIKRIGERWRVFLQTVQHGVAVQPRRDMTPANTTLRIVLVAIRSKHTYDLVLNERLMEI